MNKIGSKNIYITTECNLECTYCYEKRKRDEGFPIKSITDKEIDLFVESILSHSEKNITSVLIGGEPFIRPDLLEKTVITAIEKCKSTKNINFIINTNGTLLKQNSESVKKLYSLNVKFIISYDGDFNSDRVFPDGTNSRFCVEENLEWMMEMGYKYTFSTVVNEDDKYFIANILRMSLKYKPENIILRIRDDKTNGYIKNEVLIKKLELVYNKTKIPICKAVCNVCHKKCGWNSQDLDQEYIIPGNEKIVTITSEERKRGYHFDHF